MTGAKAKKQKPSTQAAYNCAQRFEKGNLPMKSPSGFKAFAEKNAEYADSYIKSNKNLH